VHRNARLTLWGRQELVRRIKVGAPIAHVAIEMNVSRPTASKWWGRYLADPDGQWWVDRSSRPHHCPHQTSRKVERRILSLRRNKKLGPARIAGQVGMPASTVHRVLVRHQMNRLAWMDRPTGRVIRRYEHTHPGDLVHPAPSHPHRAPGRLRVHPHRHRRPQPRRLQRDPRQRDRRDRSGVLATSPLVVRPPRHQRHRRAHRQRVVLQGSPVA
jgi:hypothetical protein